MSERNAAYHRIRKEISRQAYDKWLLGTSQSESAIDRSPFFDRLERNDIADDESEDEAWPFDATIILGDLNYRVDTSRRAMERFMRPQQLLAKAKRKVEERNAHLLTRSRKDDVPPADSTEYEEEEDEEEEWSTDRETPTGGQVDVAALVRRDTQAMRVPPHRLALLETMMCKDQLRLQIDRKIVFSEFSEGKVDFYPTFKYDVDSGVIDSSEKLRCPSWPDRILFSCGGRGHGAMSERRLQGKNKDMDAMIARKDSEPPCALELLEYGSIDARSSDHRPVVSLFSITFSRRNQE